MTPVSLSTVIVAHDSLVDLRRSLPALIAQLHEGDEIIVVDNASTDGLAEALPQLAPDTHLIHLATNEGFAGGANRGAAAARGDLLVFLNPDARVSPGWAQEIRAPWGGVHAAWMGLVLMDDGTINTSGGVLHFTGFGWAGRIGEPAAVAGPAPSEVAFLSGACLAIPRAHWTSAGGFPARFFMYCEDVDLSLRLRLGGDRLAVVPQAQVIHSYSFAKGDYKWRLLERNRWATIIRTYPGRLLLAVAPALAVTEVAVWLFAMRAGWGLIKAGATLDVVRQLPQLLRERRDIQARRSISPAQFAAAMTSELSSPYFGRAGRHPLVRRLMGLYWSAVMAVL